MAWLPRSFTSSLRLEDEDDSGAEDDVPPSPHRDRLPHASSSPMTQQQNDADLRIPSQGDDEEESQSRGVKEDLSEFRETLARRLWEVASFLAPPPAHSNPQSQPFDQSDTFGEDEVHSEDEGEPAWGLKSDAGGIGGKFQKMASNLMSIRPEEGEMDKRELGSRDWTINGKENEMEEEHHDDYDDHEDDNIRKIVEETVGITEEVLAFAMNIAHHPETWLDFPLEAEDDLDDFEMSAAQQKHVMVIEHLAPRLAALRIELCPCHMNESYFWKVYFVLLHSRLDKHDAEILSTSQVMEARALWMKELQKKTKPDSEWWERSTSHLKDSEVEDNTIPFSPRNIHSRTAALQSCSYEDTTPLKTIRCETEKHPVENSEMKIVDKSVIQEKPVTKSEAKRYNFHPSSEVQIQTYEDDEDDWPEEDTDLNCNSRTTIPLGDVDDISFSDLEDDDDDIKKIVAKRHQL